MCVCGVGTLQKQKNIAGALAFWMANASELLNFIKQDRDLSRVTLDAQDVLAHLVQMAFKSVCVCVGLWGGNLECRAHFQTGAGREFGPFSVEVKEYEFVR